MLQATEILTHFSLSEDEVEIYLVLLRLGPATVSEVAKKIKKNRTATHFHLKKLLDKDIIQNVGNNRTLVFTALSPTKLAARIDRLTTDFKSIVPQLEALKKVDTETPQVQVSESRSGYFGIYDEISSLPEGATFYAIEGADAFQNELSLLSPEAAQAFYLKMIERNIEVKVILTQEASRIPQAAMSAETLALFKKRRITVRIHPESTLPFHGLTLLYGKTLAYLIPGKDLLITIKHSAVAESFRATFDALFSFGQPYSYRK